MAQSDVQRSQEFRKCIECFLCQNVCHVVRDHDENKQAFAGPRFLMRIAELEMHPLDTLDRRNQAQEEHGLGYCNITKCCTEVCPENIKITDNALIPMKERVVDRKYDPVVWLGNKLFRRISPACRRGPGIRATQRFPVLRPAVKLSPATMPSPPFQRVIAGFLALAVTATVARFRRRARNRCGGTRSGPPGRPPSLR